MTDSAYRPKLIEVALPLAAINREAAREKSIRHGHPSTLHLWWSRKPLAAVRGVIWSSLVDDPSGDESLTLAEQAEERRRLFGILERLVKWENSNNPNVLAEARAEIDRCCPAGPPPILDPFAGGGAIPLEAQRLGLTALAGDLNPVAVLINKAMIEVAPRFNRLPPVHPDIDATLTTWERAQGLAADVQAYGRWMREEARQRLGHLYPDATGPDGEKLTPIAWKWARTVESPDPSWSGHVPLVTSWTLANRPGKPRIWIEPVIDRYAMTIHYEIREGGEPSHSRTIERGNGRCIATGAAIPAGYIKSEGASGCMGSDLIAIVAEGSRGRRYCAPTSNDLDASLCGLPAVLPDCLMSDHPQYMGTPRYGLNEWWKLFSSRQLIALTTFSELLAEIEERIIRDALAGGMDSTDVRLRDGGKGARAYADAVITYLAFAIDKCADYWSTLCTWHSSRELIRNTFSRQAIPMSWDFAECNPFSTSTGNWIAMVDWIAKAELRSPPGRTSQHGQRVLGVPDVDWTQSPEVGLVLHGKKNEMPVRLAGRILPPAVGHLAPSVERIEVQSIQRAQRRDAHRRRRARLLATQSDRLHHDAVTPRRR